MRLFVAVEIDDEARRVAAAAADALRATIRSAFTARWVAPENMHLTVRFIGHVDDVRAPSIVDALCRPLEIPSFDLELGGFGAFPASGPPRVLWMGLVHGLPSLKLMHDACNRR